MGGKRQGSKPTHPIVKTNLTVGRRYYASVDEVVRWPPEIVDYNKRFTKLLQIIKHRHDPVVTTMGMIISATTDYTNPNSDGHQRVQTKKATHAD